MIYNCQHCGKENKKEGRKHRFCNRICYHAYTQGKTFPNKKTIKKGQHLSPNTEFKKGLKPWNYGIRKTRLCVNCGKEFVVFKNSQCYCSKGCASSSHQKGKNKSLQARQNMSKAKTKESIFMGFKNRRKSIITSFEYRNWRINVFKRDSFTCQICRKVGVYLEAHHIKSWSKYPELRLDVNNGITLCKECHMFIDDKRRRFGGN